MDIDLRLPLGLLFALLGGLMFVFGLFSPPAMYDRSLGININRDWGAVLIVFGLVMLGLWKLGKKS